MRRRRNSRAELGGAAVRADIFKITDDSLNVPPRIEHGRRDA
jgi:hypothetical protein